MRAQTKTTHSSYYCYRRKPRPTTPLASPSYSDVGAIFRHWLLACDVRFARTCRGKLRRGAAPHRLSARAQTPTIKAIGGYVRAPLPPLPRRPPAALFFFSSVCFSLYAASLSRCGRRDAALPHGQEVEGGGEPGARRGVRGGDRRGRRGGGARQEPRARRHGPWPVSS